MLKDLCFEIIQTCPNKCKFCSSNSSIEKTTLVKIEDFKKTVTHFLNHGGIQEISISGGEPFLHPDLFEMIKFCNENKLRTVIFTSGIKKINDLTYEMIEDIHCKCEQDIQNVEEHEPWNERLKDNIRKYYEKILNSTNYTSITKEELETLKNLGLSKIVFDWQAVDTSLDNELMGRKELNTYVMSSMIRASHVGLNVDVHFIPMKLNYKEFSKIIECLEIANIKNISVLNFVPQGRGLDNIKDLMLNESELKEFGKILNREKEKYSGKIRIGIPLDSRISHLCTAGTEKLDIKYDGTILPCPAFKEISVETMEKYNIKLYSIYDDLEKIVLPKGKRSEPLCKQVYGFKGDLN